MTTSASWVTSHGPIIASVTAVCLAVWSNRRDNKRRRIEEAENRRNDSILGAIIIASLLEEVRTGHKIMTSILHGINADSEIATQWVRGIYQVITNPGDSVPVSSTKPASGALFAQAQPQMELSGTAEGNPLQLLPGASW